MFNDETKEAQPAVRDKLGRWLPGVSGNPLGEQAGRPVSIVSRLREYLANHPDEVDTIGKQLVELGKKPNLKQLEAIKELMDRIDGKVIERHKVDMEIPITLVFTPAYALDNMDSQRVIEGHARELVEGDDEDALETH